MAHRAPMNVCKREFRTKLEATEWVERQVVRRARQIEYQVNVRDVGNLAEKVEILDRTNGEYVPETGDEPLKKLCHVWRQSGLYRVGIPAAGW